MHRKSVRHLTVLLLGIVFGFLPVTEAGAVDTYTIDPVHSHIGFRIRHLNVSFIYGRFNGPVGTLAFDEKSPGKSSVDISVKAADIDTASTKRDNHLKSKEFFNIDTFPEIRFRSKRVRHIKDDVYGITGDLTLLGKTRTIDIEARRTGAGKDPWGGTRIGFESEFSIKRSDYGMDFMLGPIGDDVDITVSVEAKK